MFSLKSSVHQSEILPVDVVNNSSVMSEDNLKITVEFGGGAELLFDNKKVHNIELPVNHEKWNLGSLLSWMKDNMLKERPELFVQDKSVRPGILVLINDADWELLDTVNYAIQPNDKITFISTLHGG